MAPFNPNNNDQLDQKNNNNNNQGIDGADIKLTVKDDQTLQLHERQSRANSQIIINSQSNSLINSNTQSTLCNSVTADNLANDQPQSLPPAYCEVPGIVPIAAGTSNGPPPTYDEVI